MSRETHGSCKGKPQYPISAFIFNKLDPDSDTDSHPEEYSFCIAVCSGVTGQDTRPGLGQLAAFCRLFRLSAMLTGGQAEMLKYLDSNNIAVLLLGRFLMIFQQPRGNGAERGTLFEQR
jgi:hypothetical protein